MTTQEQERQMSAEGNDPKEKRAGRKVYVVVGDVRAFKSVVDAEKFLNTDPTAPRDFTVIRGMAVEKKQRVSLR